MVKHTNPRNPAIADALLKTQDGRHIVFEARHEIKSQEIGTRIRQLKALVYETFVSKVPEGHRVHRDVYQDAKPVIRSLGVKGGIEFTRAITALKFAWSSQDACRDAVKLITTK